MKTEDAEILKEARERFSRGYSAAQPMREHFIKNLKFVSGDQWSEEAKKARNERPQLVINRLRAFASILVNEQRQNELAAKISPRGYGANEETAEVFSGMVRDIESVSDFEIAVDTAFKYTIEGNHGWWCIRKEYESEESVDYVLRYEAIEDPLCVLCDPSARKATRSDMRWLFKFHDIPKDEYKQRYADAQISDFTEDHMKQAPEWVKEDAVMVAEYWRVQIKKKHLLVILDMATGQTRKVFQEDTDEKFTPEQIFAQREVECRYVEQFILNGVEVLEHNEWDGQWIPFIPVIGDERWIDGKRHIFSAISHSHDAQRMTNYYTSAEAESTGFAPLPVWLGAVGQFKSDPNWGNPKKPVGTREYDAMSVGDKVVPPPQWMSFEPPTQSFLLGKQGSIDDLKATMGMSDALTGLKETDQSGKAIEALKQQGNTANFNFFDNLIRSIKHSTEVLVDLIPHVYDTEREVRILGPDKKDKIVRVNAQLQSKDGVPEMTADGKPKGYFLNIGQYGVAIEVGPSSQTQQEQDSRDIMEALDIVGKTVGESDPEAFRLFLYLFARAHSGPVWEQMAKHFQPPNLDGQQVQIPPQVQQQMQQQAAALQEALAQLQELQKVIESKQIESASREKIAEMDNRTKLAIEQIRAALDEMKIHADLEKARLDNRTELTKAHAEIESRETIAQHQSEEARVMAMHESGEREKDRQASKSE